ncbi:ABC transporter permease [Acidobacteriota bacterium]
MANLARSNLTQRKTRAAISIISVAVEVTLVLILIGLTTGSLNEVGRRIENLDSDIILLPPGSQPILSMNLGTMPIRGVSGIMDGIPEIRAYTPVVFGNTTKFGSFGMVFGIEPESYQTASRGIELLDGEHFTGPNSLILDRRLAAAENLSVGDEVDLFNRPFTISGVCQDGAGVRIYAPLSTLQDVFGKKRKTSSFLIKCTDEDQIQTVLAKLKDSPPLKGYVLINNRNYSKMLMNNAFGLKEFITAIMFVAITFGFLVILLAMYTTIVERTRQIGILKSLGASKCYIMKMIMEEASILCFIGVLLGYILAGSTKLGLERLHPTLTIEITLQWIALSGLLAIAGGFLGALYPAMRAASIDPVQALQEE